MEILILNNAYLMDNGGLLCLFKHSFGLINITNLNLLGLFAFKCVDLTSLTYSFIGLDLINSTSKSAVLPNWWWFIIPDFWDFNKVLLEVN